MFFSFKHLVPFVGIPLGGESRTKHTDIEHGSNIQFGYLLEAKEDTAPTRPPFFNANHWQPPD